MIGGLIMDKTVKNLIRVRIEELKERQSKSWVKDDEKRAIPYMIKVLNDLLTTIQWNDFKEV